MWVVSYGQEEEAFGSFSFFRFLKPVRVGESLGEKREVSRVIYCFFLVYRERGNVER